MSAVYTRQVLSSLTRRFELASDVDLAAVSARCSPQLTGADLYALCADAWMGALKRSIADAEAGSMDLSGQVGAWMHCRC